jgi:hypothetical protein
MEMDIRKENNNIDSILFSDEYKIESPARNVICICSTDEAKGASGTLVAIHLDEVDTMILALKKAKEIFKK